METLIRLSPGMTGFLCDAVEEDPNFLYDYVIPTLNGYEDPEQQFLSDISDEITNSQLRDSGLGELGNLGKSVFKRIGKAIHKVEKRVGKEVKRIAKKEGPLIIQAAGAVLAPFTGGASLAVAAAITAANQLRLKKIAAAKAKRETKAAAAQVSSAAGAANLQTTQQLDTFYQQNQSWLQARGISQPQWNAMSMQQKIDAINAASQQPAPTAQAPVQDFSQPQQAMPSGGGGGYAPSGGGSYGDGGGGDARGSYGAPQQPGQPRVAQASMFDSSMLPLLAGGIALALIFGKPMKGGGRRSKRNSGRRHRRVA